MALQGFRGNCKKLKRIKADPLVPPMAEREGKRLREKLRSRKV